MANKAYVILHENSLVFHKRQILLNSTENNSENEINIIETDLTEFVQDEYEYLEEWPMPSENLDKNLLLSNDSNLDEKTFEKFKKLLEDNKSAFAWSFDDLKEPCLVAEHTISINSERPIRSLPYRKSPAENEIIKTEIAALLKANIILLSSSPWSAPIVLVPKPDGTKRFCVDFRKLNAVTIQDPFPMPRIDDILDRLNNVKWYTNLDLKQGYMQPTIAPASIPLTGFSTADGHY